MRAAHLLNTYASLILAYVAVTLPVAIWMLRGFLARMPLTLEEAAAIDGAGPVRTFFEIIVPLCRPGIVATAVFVLIVTWQEFLFALSFTSTKEMRTLPVGMNDFIGQYGIRYGELMASSVLISLPVVVVFMILQRQFVSGLTAGAGEGLSSMVRTTSSCASNSGARHRPAHLQPARQAQCAVDADAPAVRAAARRHRAAIAACGPSS